LVRNPHAGQLFTSSDEQIADALLDVSIPTLMLSLVHMSADPTLIRGALKPAGLFLNEVQGYMSDEDKSAVRKIALEVIADYRDRGCPEPEPVGPALLKEMMEWLVCEPVPDEYVPMLLEEMELDGVDERAGKPLPLSVFWLHAHWCTILVSVILYGSPMHLRWRWVIALHARQQLCPA
jgi:4-hydroxyacetophenone monooxygenase